jgi:hypothetical protein
MLRHLDRRIAAAVIATIIAAVWVGFRPSARAGGRARVFFRIPEIPTHGFAVCGRLIPRQNVSCGAQSI